MLANYTDISTKEKVSKLHGSYSIIDNLSDNFNAQIALLVGYNCRVS